MVEQKKLMKNKDPNIRILEQNLMEKIGMNVEIKNKKNNKGSIIFNYKELDQLFLFLFISLSNVIVLFQ